MDIQSPIAQRLAAFIKYTKLSPTAFARSIGVGQPAISLILTGRRKGISVEMLEKITKCNAELNPEWLLYGRGDMLREKKSEKKYEGQEMPSSVVNEPEGGMYGGASAAEWMRRYTALQEKYIALLEERARLEKRVLELEKKKAEK